MCGMASLIEQSSFDGEEGTWDMARALPHAALQPGVVEYAGYRESASKSIWRREVPSAIIPLIINFGAPFHLRDGKRTDGCYRSFAAGLYSGPVIVGSAGAAYCMQVNFTPLGALRFFHLPQSDIADRTVSLEDILGAEGRDLAYRLRDAKDWSARFSLLDGFIAERFARAHDAKATVIEAWHGLASQHGRMTIREIARKIGVSRRHLAKLCLSELGMTPKSLARILRFDHARKLARTVPRLGWAELAFETGYADQAHLVREFRALSGLTPSKLLRRDRAETGIIEPSPH
jgi:AraC-like DNA-binding protein